MGPTWSKYLASGILLELSLKTLKKIVGAPNKSKDTDFRAMLELVLDLEVIWIQGLYKL
jgi:hypothetical protein